MKTKITYLLIPLVLGLALCSEYSPPSPPEPYYKADLIGITGSSIIHLEIDKDLQVISSTTVNLSDSINTLYFQPPSIILWNGSHSVLYQINYITFYQTTSAIPSEITITTSVEGTTELSTTSVIPITYSPISNYILLSMQDSSQTSIGYLGVYNKYEETFLDIIELTGIVPAFIVEGSSIYGILQSTQSYLFLVQVENNQFSNSPLISTSSINILLSTSSIGKNIFLMDEDTSKLLLNAGSKLLVIDPQSLNFQEVILSSENLYPISIVKDPPQNIIYILSGTSNNFKVFKVNYNGNEYTKLEDGELTYSKDLSNMILLSSPYSLQRYLLAGYEDKLINVLNGNSIYSVSSNIKELAINVIWGE